MLKAMVGGILGFLGFTKTEEVKAEDLGVNSCLLIGDKVACFDIEDVAVFDRTIQITTNRKLITTPTMFAVSDIIYGTTPIHGTINFTRNGLKQRIEFNNYSVKWQFGADILSENFEADVVMVIDLVPQGNQNESL
jgi:hypothetical protein